jgi:hypothetical protein
LIPTLVAPDRIWPQTRAAGTQNRARLEAALLPVFASSGLEVTRDVRLPLQAAFVARRGVQGVDHAAFAQDLRQHSRCIDDAIRCFDERRLGRFSPSSPG